MSVQRIITAPAPDRRTVNGERSLSNSSCNDGYAVWLDENKRNHKRLSRGPQPERVLSGDICKSAELGPGHHGLARCRHNEVFKGRQLVSDQIEAFHLNDPKIKFLALCNERFSDRSRKESLAIICSMDGLRIELCEKLNSRRMLVSGKRLGSRRFSELDHLLIKSSLINNPQSSVEKRLKFGNVKIVHVVPVWVHLKYWSFTIPEHHANERVVAPQFYDWAVEVVSICLDESEGQHVMDSRPVLALGCVATRPARRARTRCTP